MENWNKISFTELISDRTKDGIKLPTNEYNQSGLTAIIDQGQEFIAGYSDETEGAFTDVPAIIFGDHTRVFKYVDFPFFLGADGVKVLKANQEINYKYLYYYFLQAKFPNTGYARHFKWLKELKIPLPPLETQRQIAAQLDKCTSIISKHMQMLEKYDTLIKSQFVEMFGDNPIDNGKWKVESLEELCKIITDGTHQPPKFTTSGIPFLFVSNIAGNKITYETEKFISEETYAELYKRTPIEIGDLLLSTVGSYGHPAIVENDKKFLFQRHIAYLKPKTELLDSVYFHGALLSPDAQKQIEERVKGIAQKTLNLSEIRKIKIPLPPLSLQNNFAQFVQAVDAQKAKTQQSMEKAETLYKSLMQEYFG